MGPTPQYSSVLLTPLLAFCPPPNSALPSPWIAAARLFVRMRLFFSFSPLSTIPISQYGQFPHCSLIPASQLPPVPSLNNLLLFPFSPCSSPSLHLFISELGPDQIPSLLNGPTGGNILGLFSVGEPDCLPLWRFCHFLETHSLRNPAFDLTAIILIILLRFQTWPPDGWLPAPVLNTDLAFA